MDEMSGFNPQQRQKIFSSSLCVQTDSGAHPASCTKGTGGPFPGGQSVAGAWRWLLTPFYCRGYERVAATPTLPPSASMAYSGTAFLYLSWNTLNMCFSLNVKASSNIHRKNYNNIYIYVYIY
jgi:hypothetical protein